MDKQGWTLGTGEDFDDNSLNNGSRRKGATGTPPNYKKVRATEVELTQTLTDPNVTHMQS
jgi:hypothetical protein